MIETTRQSFQALRALVAAWSLLFMLSSCSTDTWLTDSEQVPLNITVECDRMMPDDASTRAATYATATQDVEFSTGKSIRIYATNTSAKDGLVYTVGSNGLLSPPDVTKPPYYPSGDTKTDIKGYYPGTVTSSTTSFPVQTNQTSTANYELSDLMTAVLNNQGRTTDYVSLQFQHRMARLNIGATATDGLVIQGISLLNVKTSASYNSTTNQWAGSGTTSTISVATGGTGTTLSGVAVFPAQTITSQNFIQITTNRGNALFMVASKEFKEGRAYSAALEVGLQNLTATAVITDWSATTGTVTKMFVQNTGLQITTSTEALTYSVDGTGNPVAKRPATITVKNGDTTLSEGSDYDLQFFNNTAAGNAMVVAVVKSGNQVGESLTGSAVIATYIIGQATCNMRYTLASKELEFQSGGTVENELLDKGDGTMTYTSSNPEVAVVTGTGVVSMLSYGTTTIRASMAGDNNYVAKTVEYTLKVTKRNVSHFTVTLASQDQSISYDGTAHTPYPIVYDGGVRCYENSDYTLSWSNNVNAGTGIITLTGMGDYNTESITTKEFTIEKATTTLTWTAVSKTIGVGEEYDLGARSNFDFVNISYSSSDDSKASVSTDGIVTGVGPGDNVTITAQVNATSNYKASGPLSVKLNVQTVETTFLLTSSEQIYTCPADAVYTFELYGGAGGNYNSGKGGYGGIVKASKALSAGTVVYVYVGGQGGTSGGYNGGGNPASGYSGGGGGGTDIRIGGNAIADRQLVAGGGGGATGRRMNGDNGGSSRSGTNGRYFYGSNCSSSTGGGGGGGYIGGYAGTSYSGGYAGSNYIADDWTVITNGVSSNGPTSSSDSQVYNGKVIVTYKFE